MAPDEVATQMILQEHYITLCQRISARSNGFTKGTEDPFRERIFDKLASRVLLRWRADHSLVLRCCTLYERDKDMPLFRNFGKKSTRAEPTRDPVTAITVDDADLRRADQVVQRYLRAVGTTDAEIRAAELAISQAGGELSIQQSIELAARTGDPGLGRPWFWLAAVAREAQHRGDRDLVARISLFFSKPSVASFAGIRYTGEQQ